MIDDLLMSANLNRFYAVSYCKINMHSKKEAKNGRKLH